MNCPTVLKILRKFKNDIIVNRWKHLRAKNHHNIQKAYDKVYKWSFDNDQGFDTLMITMYFYKNNEHTQGKRNEYVYNVVLSEDRVWIFYNIFKRGIYRGSLQPLALSEVLYEDLESTLFQQSLLGDTGMFGSQEVQVLQELKEIYFPKEE